MKNYIAIEDTKLRRGDLYLKVYNYSNKGLRYIGVMRYQPQSTRGINSEVMTFLSQQEEIAKKYGDNTLYYENEKPPFYVTVMDPNYMFEDIEKKYNLLQK